MRVVPFHPMTHFSRDYHGNPILMDKPGDNTEASLRKKMEKFHQPRLNFCFRLAITVFDGILDARACKTHPILVGQIQEKNELYLSHVRRRAIF